MIFVNWLYGFPKWSSNSIRGTQIFESTERCSPRWAGRTTHGEWSNCRSRSKRSARRPSHRYLKPRPEPGAGAAAQKSGLPKPRLVRSNRRYWPPGTVRLRNVSLRSIGEYTLTAGERADVDHGNRLRPFIFLHRSAPGFSQRFFNLLPITVITQAPESRFASVQIALRASLTVQEFTSVKPNSLLTKKIYSLVAHIR